jgi:hypothetical protein
MVLLIIVVRIKLQLSFFNFRIVNHDSHGIATLASENFFNHIGVHECCNSYFSKLLVSTQIVIGTHRLDQSFNSVSASYTRVAAQLFPVADYE